MMLLLAGDILQNILKKTKICDIWHEITESVKGTANSNNKIQEARTDGGQKYSKGNHWR